MNADTPYRRLYPENETITFGGGKDNKFEPALIPDNEATDCQNVEFVNAVVTTRQGAVRLNTAPAGNVAFDGIYTRRDNNGSQTMCAFIGGHMMTLSGTTFNTVPSAQSVFTIGSRVAAEMAQNYLFVGNGASTYKWDGTYFTQHGVYPPTQTAVVNSGTITGSLSTSGTYQYVYTNVNTALVEGNYSPAITFTVGTASLSTRLSNIASGATASMGVAYRYIYRTLNINSAVTSSFPAYYRVGRLLDVSSSTFVDTMSDATLAGQTSGNNDRGTPPTYNAIIFHQNLLFCNDSANPNYVWYSTPSDSFSPFTFPSTNFFKVGDKSGDLVRGFAAYDNYVVIFCDFSTWINYMPDPADPTTWKQIKANSPYGCKSPYAIIKCDVRGQNLLLHPAIQNTKFVGFGALSGMSLDPSVSFQAVTTVGSDLKSQRIEPDMFQVREAFQGNFSAITFKNRAFISLTYGSGQTTNNRVYVWDYSLTNIGQQQPESWSPWTGTPFNIAQFCIYNANLYGASAGTNGYVYQLNNSGVYNDDGDAIDSYYTTKEFGGYPEDIALLKDWRYVNMLLDMAGAYNMTIYYRTDSTSIFSFSQNVSLDNGATDWGTGMTWGVSQWGSGVTQSEPRIFLGASVRGKRLQLKFTNQNVVNQRFTVHRMQLAYNIRGYR